MLHGIAECIPDSLVAFTDMSLLQIDECMQTFRHLWVVSEKGEETGNILMFCGHA